MGGFSFVWNGEHVAQEKGRGLDVLSRPESSVGDVEIQAIFLNTWNIWELIHVRHFINYKF